MDPSVPLEDGTCPFLDASDHMIDRIFRTLSDGQKYKMQMELVCNKFQSRIKERSSWQGENKLELGKDEDNILINGYKFSFGKAGAALSKLLDRITVEKFVLNDMSDIPLDVLMDLCTAIASHKDFVNLRIIQICGYFDYSTIMTTIAACGLEQVVKIACGDWSSRKFITSLSPSFYYVLDHCCNLKTCSLRITDLSQIWGFLLPALENCHKIKNMNISGDLTQQNAIEFAEFCSTPDAFPNLISLQFQPSCPIPEPLEFIGALSEQIRSNMVSFCIRLHAGIAAHRQFFVTIFDQFPILKSLSIVSITKFPTETILEAVGNIFANYGGNGTDFYKLKLSVYAENRGDVFAKLALKKWNENDEFVKIEAINGVWKCIKDNVEITLDLR